MAHADSPLVVANFRTLMGAYGNTVAGYKHDIQDAQAAGLDGFVLDIEGYQTPELAAIQAQEVADLFTAAQQLGTNFKLAIDIDCFANSPRDACQAGTKTLVDTYSRHPNYLQFQGRPYLTAYNDNLNVNNGSSDYWLWSSVLAGVAANNPVFVPTFATWGTSPTSVPFPPDNANAIVENWFTAGWLPNVARGLSAWGALSPTPAIANNNAFSATAQRHGIPFVASAEAWHSPIRMLSQGIVTSGGMNPSLDFHGGEGMSAIWSNIINNLKPPMVYVVTWNDYTESYIGPASQATLTTAASGQELGLNRWQITGDYLYSHAAYTELTKYFVQWYKTGQQPVWPDAMYVFYRTAPMSTVASKAPAGTQIGWNEQGNPTLDDVYITTILKSPATLRVSTGSKVVSFKVPAGLHHTRVPFQPGAQIFTLNRYRTQLIKITGKNITTSEPYYYNVNPITFYGYHR